ncbi:MAG: hypothetical protein ONA90_08720, partial [candidate division KSB1 bacterium]|nr:hypothetical protein [candidate division KSB1 bacterium]
TMRKIFIPTVLLVLNTCSVVAAQAVIKILEVDKNTGIIDRGEADGIRVGDVFEVNRSDGEFLYWVGRVEVVVVKPKMAGVKMIARADKAEIKKGDVLELRKAEYDPLYDKMNRSSPTINPTPISSRAATSGKDTDRMLTPAEARTEPVRFGLSLGFSQPMKRASESLGLEMTLRIVDPSNNRVVDVVDMTHAYTTSMTLQAYCTLPVARRFVVNLSYAFVPLNVKSKVTSDLLQNALKASASLMNIAASINYRLNSRLHFGLGSGLFLPQVKVEGGNRALTLTDRQIGFSANATYVIPLGSRIALRSDLVYNVFLEDGPAIHYLTLQTGPSFAMGKR